LAVGRQNAAGSYTAHVTLHRVRPNAQPAKPPRVVTLSSLSEARSRRSVPALLAVTILVVPASYVLRAALGLGVFATRHGLLGLLVLGFRLASLGRRLEVSAGALGHARTKARRVPTSACNIREGAIVIRQRTSSRAVFPNLDAEGGDGRAAQRDHHKPKIETCACGAVNCVSARTGTDCPSRRRLRVASCDRPPSASRGSRGSWVRSV